VGNTHTNLKQQDHCTYRKSTLVLNKAVAYFGRFSGRKMSNAVHPELESNSLVESMPNGRGEPLYPLSRTTAYCQRYLSLFRLSRRTSVSENRLPSSTSVPFASGNDYARKRHLQNLSSTGIRTRSIIHRPRTNHRLDMSSHPGPRMFYGKGFTEKHSIPDSASNPIQWLEASCPQDVIPRVVAFTGPQMAAILMKTNRFWYNLMMQESTWRVLSEELYKWKESRDPAPVSWKEFYRLHPCVPTDYSTIHKALVMTSLGSSRSRDTVTHILLRPGKHFVRETLHIHTSPTSIVVVETMELPSDWVNSIIDHRRFETPQKSRRGRSASVRKIMACNSRDEEDYPTDDDIPSYPVIPSVSSRDGAIAAMPRGRVENRAEVILKTKRNNTPMFRVSQGFLKLVKVDLQHHSAGVDIWNGNTAVQVQPSIGRDDRSSHLHPRSRAHLEHVNVRSSSGRGVVNIDGGHLTLRWSCIHDCAATGIYIGGLGSHAELSRSDVIRNGVGSRSRRGVGRGHSGVYLEQGTAKITECNISSNSLTGISAISPDNAILYLEHSDLVSNGSYQVELPPVGTTARQQSITNHNNIAMNGVPTLRSGLSLSVDPIWFNDNLAV